MKVILIALFFAPFLLHSQFSPSFKLGLKYYKKGKYDKALNCFYRAEDNISKDYKYELYQLIMEVNLIKTNENTYERSKEITQAYKYLKKLEKKNKLSTSELVECNKTIVDSSAHYLIQLCAINRRYRRLESIVQNMKSNEFHEFALLLYETVINKEFTTANYSDFVQGYKNLFNAEVKLSALAEQTIKSESNKIFYMIAATNNKAMLADLIGIEAFESSFMNSLRNEVLEKVRPYTDTIDMFSWNEHYTYGIWDLAKSYHDLHPSLVDQDMMKKLLINHLYHYRNFGNHEIVNGCYDAGKMCFDNSPITVTIEIVDREISRSYVINDQLPMQIFKDILCNSQFETNHWVIGKLIEDNESFIENHKDEVKLVLFEWIKDDYPAIINLFRYHNKFGDLESSTFLSLFKEVANEYIHQIALSDEEYATKLLVDLSGTFPYDSYESHYNWFITHFRTKMKAKNTKKMGKEMIALNHIFETNEEIIALKRDYLVLDYKQSHETSSLKADEIQWTGDHNTCDPGTLSSVYYDKMLERINFFRRWVGVNDSISFSHEYNEKAQHAAFMMSVRKALSHHPTKSWKCYTDLGYQGASHGNLYLGSFLSGSIDGYIDDSGQNAAGHRQWILSTSTEKIGSGSVPFNDELPGANCLYVVTENRNLNYEGLYKDSPVLWPPQGHVPLEFVEQLDVWTFTMESANFDNISVRVIINGKDVPVEIYKDNWGSYGSSSYFSMQFDTEELTKKLSGEGFHSVTTRYTPFNAGDVIRVSVKNVIMHNGQLKDFQYEVLPFNPDPAKKTYVLSRN